jgi:hypothetical protein
MKKLIKKPAVFLFALCFLPIAFLCALVSRVVAKPIASPKLFWGSTPLLNNSYWSRAMEKAGFKSETFTNGFYEVINQRNDWDRILDEQYCCVPRFVKKYIAFCHSLFLYDVFFISFDGVFIGATPVRYFQAKLLKIAGKKIVVLPYGGDSFVYRNIRSTSTVHGLLMSYPLASRNQDSISRVVQYWTMHADAVIPGQLGPDGFGRWDALLPSILFVDLDLLKMSEKTSMADGLSEEVVIVHTPNHRGFKGTEFLVESVEKLKNEGLKVRLILLEGKQNCDVLGVLQTEADILVEQLIITGVALSGLEGMASGLPTISNLDDDAYTLPWRRWSYFSECPIVSANPENLVSVLRELVVRPGLRHELGKAGRAYAEKYHGVDSAQYLFTNVIDYLYGRKESLINLYHPLLGEYPNRSPKIQHPLVNNRIVG